MSIIASVPWLFNSALTLPFLISRTSEPFAASHRFQFQQFFQADSSPDVGPIPGPGAAGIRSITARAFSSRIR